MFYIVHSHHCIPSTLYTFLLIQPNVSYILCKKTLQKQTAPDHHIASLSPINSSFLSVPHNRNCYIHCIAYKVQWPHYQQTLVLLLTTSL